MKKQIDLPEEYLKTIKIAQKNMEKYKETIAATMANAASINEIITSNMASQMSEAINTYYNQIYQNKNLFRVLSEIPKISSEFANNFNENYSRLTKIEQKLNRINKIMTNTFASDKIINSIASIRAAIDVYNPPDLLIKQSLEMPVAYQSFAKRQYNYAEKNELISQRATTVANEAGNFVLYHQISSETSMEMLNEIEQEENQDETLTVVPSKTNIFSMLNQHISNVYRSDRNPNVIETISSSIPAQINSYGCSVVELIYKINRLYQSSKGISVFKPTVKGMYGSSLLSSQVATNEDTFGKIVDFLYFMIYEGSGEAKRLTNIVSDEELEALWYLKHLRLNFRHDVEHGDDIDKKLLKGGNAFDYLIGKPMPLAVSDWKRAQLNLYIKLTNMLEIVINNIG